MVTPYEVEPIQSERLILRILTESDASQAYMNWMNDPEIVRYLEVRFRSWTQEEIRDDITRFANSGVFLFGMFLRKASGEGEGPHIGNIRIGPVIARHSRAGIGIMVGDRGAWGKGFATEAIQAVTQFGLKKLGLQKVVAGVYEPNFGSTKAFQKAGFVIEAILPNYWQSGSERVGEVLLGYDPE